MSCQVLLLLRVFLSIRIKDVLEFETTWVLVLRHKRMQASLSRGASLKRARLSSEDVLCVANGSETSSISVVERAQSSGVGLAAVDVFGLQRSGLEVFVFPSWRQDVGLGSSNGADLKHLFLIVLWPNLVSRVQRIGMPASLESDVSHITIVQLRTGHRAELCSDGMEHTGFRAVNVSDVEDVPGLEIKLLLFDGLSAWNVADIHLVSHELGNLWVYKGRGLELVLWVEWIGCLSSGGKLDTLRIGKLDVFGHQLVVYFARQAEMQGSGR